MMDIDQIKKWLPHRQPFLFLDAVDTLEANKSATGRFLVKATEPYFAGHFPGNPVMPGVIMLEAMAQLACVLAFKSKGSYNGDPVYLMGFNEARFRRMVKPGETLHLFAEVKKSRRNLWVFQCKAEVDGALAVECEMLAGFG